MVGEYSYFHSKPNGLSIMNCLVNMSTKQDPALLTITGNMLNAFSTHTNYINKKFDMSRHALGKPQSLLYHINKANKPL